jgi:hypothetical protein
MLPQEDPSFQDMLTRASASMPSADPAVSHDSAAREQALSQADAYCKTVELKYGATSPEADAVRAKINIARYVKVHQPAKL